MIGDAFGGRGVARAQRFVERVRALALEPGGVPRACHRVGRRAEVEVGERGAQVEARATHDDRRRALGDEIVDLRIVVSEQTVDWRGLVQAVPRASVGQEPAKAAPAGRTGSGKAPAKKKPAAGKKADKAT